MLELCGITKRYTAGHFSPRRWFPGAGTKESSMKTARIPGEGHATQKTGIPGEGHVTETTSISGEGHVTETGRIMGKAYTGSRPALDQVSFTLKPGIYGLLGPNGAGKSTLMNIITGNLTPTGGEVRWEGKEIRTLGAYYRSLLGYAPQQQGMYDHFSGIRFLSYMAALKGIPGKEQAEEIRRVLTFVNLWEERKRPVGTYSGGMKQRILIAQALLGDPKCIVLDEPTAGLDPKERVRVRERIQAVSGERIILVSTHVVSDIEPIATEVLLLKSGRLVDRGTVDGLCKKYGGVKGLEAVYMQIFSEEDGHDSSDSL